MADQPTEPPVPEEERQVRPFADLLRELRKGTTHDELSELLADVVAAVDDHRKKGTITFKVEIEPYKDTDAVVVRDSIKVSIPEPDRDATLMFADKGRLTRHNPNQQELPGIRAVDNEPNVAGRDAG